MSGEHGYPCFVLISVGLSPTFIHFSLWWITYCVEKQSFHHSFSRVIRVSFCITWNHHIYVYINVFYGILGKYSIIWFTINFSNIWCCLCPLLLHCFFSSFPNENSAPCFSHFPLHSTHVLLFPFLGIVHHHMCFLKFLVTAITQGYIFTSEDLDLGITDNREHAVCVFLVWVTSLNIIFDSSICCKFHDLFSLHIVSTFSLFIHQLQTFRIS